MRLFFPINFLHPIIAITLLLCLALLSSPSAHTADFLLLKSPHSFTIYNEFEQVLSDPEKAGFLPGSPLQIINADARLGDGVTRVMRCSFLNATCSLLEDDAGRLLGNREDFELLRSCLLLGDTVEIREGGAVAFSSRFPPGEAAPRLKKFEILYMIFQRGDACYALRTLPPEEFGWCPASSKAAWGRLSQRAVAPDTALSASIRQRLASIVSRASDLYKAYFASFNKSAGMQKTAPNWGLTSGGKAAMRWVLSGPWRNSGQLDESSAQLAARLREVLIGKPYVVLYENGELSVMHKP